jgi:hypothetical protein
VDTDERLALLEKKIADHETLVQKLIMLAAMTPKGRLILKTLGIDAG